MRRCRVEVKIILFDIFAVITLWSGQPEQALFEERVLPIPDRDREAH